MMSRVALAPLIRPAVAIGLMVTASAVGLSRLLPARPAGRTPREGAHVLVSPLGIDPGGPGMLWLDAESGRTTLIPPPGGRIVQHATLSPWVDESGRGQIAGRYSVPLDDPSPEGFGLVRASFPDGRAFDFVATDIVPSSPPCWYPGFRARILFAAGDGCLYHYDFEPPATPGGGSSGARPTAPIPIVWRVPGLGAEGVRISDPCWPADPRFDRVVIVCLQRMGPGRFSTRRPWWLRLGDDGASIVEAGPLLDSDTISDELEIRAPSFGQLTDGTPALAYLTGVDARVWDLRLSALDFDAAGRPTIRGGLGPRLATRCRGSIAPAFSSDGRWLGAVQGDVRGRGSLLRLDLTDVAGTSLLVARPMPTGKWWFLVAAIRAFLGLEDGRPTVLTHAFESRIGDSE